MNRPLGLLDGLGLANSAVALALASLILLVLPQRLAQRPAGSGVLALRLDSQGQLWLWNQPVRAQQLAPLLAQAARRHPQARLRLQPDPQVPWGEVEVLARRLQASPLPLDLQLP